MEGKAFNEMKDIKFLAISERGWHSVVSGFANLLKSGVFSRRVELVFRIYVWQTKFTGEKRYIRDLGFNIGLVAFFMHIRLRN